MFRQNPGFQLALCLLMLFIFYILQVRLLQPINTFIMPFNAYKQPIKVHLNILQVRLLQPINTFIMPFNAYKQPINTMSLPPYCRSNTDPT